MFVALLSSAIMLSSATAAPGSSERVREAETSYVRTIAADGAITIRGQDNETGQRFRFTIRDGVVRGWIGTKPVQFPISETSAQLR